MRVINLHTTFNITKDRNIYVGKFSSKKYPFQKADPVRCDYFSMMLILSGNGFITIDDQEYEVKEKRLFLFNDKQVIGWAHYEKVEALVIGFNSEIAHEVSVLYNFNFIDLRKKAYQYINQILLQCLEDYDKIDIKQSESINKKAIAYMTEYLGRFDNGFIIKNQDILNFKKAVIHNIELPLSIKEICEKSKINYARFNIICNQLLGLSAKSYYLDIKISEAKRLLAFSKYSISEITFKCGFEDPSYFARIFKIKTKQSPIIFRKKYQKS